MRALPVWAYVFVMAGALATVAVLKQLVPSAQVDALLSQVCNAAQVGHAPVDKELAEEINGFLARARQADDDYSKGLLKAAVGELP